MSRSLIFAALLIAPSLAMAQNAAPPSALGVPPTPPASHDRGPMHVPPHGMDGGPRHGGPGLDNLQVPPGTWWRNADTVSRLGLSPDQVKRIDSLFIDSRVQLIHLHAKLEEAELRLEPLLAESPVNQQAAMTQVALIADTRADLEKADARMLLSIRSVLTTDQWAKLQRHPDGPPGRAPRVGQHGPGSPETGPGAPPPNGL